MAKRASIVFAVKWFAVPIVLAAIGFFVLGPLLEGRAAAEEVKASAKALEEPRRFSGEPDVDVSVAPAPKRTRTRTRSAPVQRTTPSEEPPPSEQPDSEPPAAEPAQDQGAPPPPDDIGTTVPDIAPGDGGGEPGGDGDARHEQKAPPTDGKGGG
ncbi:MAG: hypothetical protein M9921_04965 [Fimbriimonadaceae bacterium]|nr:hypothetical protein [Fimbriimonadaceae bacterium]